MVECNDCVHYPICSHYKDHRHECAFFMKDKDTVEVVRCKDCVSHGNCLTEDTFRIARIDNPYCCGGKLKTNCGAKMDGGNEDA